MSASSRGDETHGFESFRDLAWSDLVDDSFIDKPTKEQAEEALGNYLVDKVLSGHMTATEACTLSFWCYFAGVNGIVEFLQLRPDSHTSHFNRQFEKTVGVDRFNKRFMQLRVHVYSKSTMG